ncbi:MAG: protein-glutamate O-methyltransferase CheR [Bacteroidetes bacterium]|nr:protein-glutamate O-methyltransferase CheR [Bacteroidota bacterium]
MKQKIEKILQYVYEQRNYDFRGNHISMLQRRIDIRVHAANTSSYDEYYIYLSANHQELDELLHVLTINVSEFFRDPLVFEYLQSLIFTTMQLKLQQNDPNVRIWSAGCSTGEEPYTLAIMLREFLKNTINSEVSIDIIGTDIDEEALSHAETGQYREELLKNVKLGLVNEYFTCEKNQYTISDNIKKMVSFSKYDLLDKNSFVPPESVFGDFDIVLCRNVLIYFNQEYQDGIFRKLYRSLHKNRYLVLGESEVPIGEYKDRFRRVNRCCKIYQKR